MRKFAKEDHVALADWSLDCAERVLVLFERARPSDVRPRTAISTGRQWVRTGEFRMSAIRGASLDAHAAAKDVVADQAACSSAHAAGQAVATAHVPQHAYGGAYYALKALIAADPEKAEQRAAAELAWQSQRLPERLRAEVMSRIRIEPRRSGLFVSIRKGEGF